MLEQIQTRLKNLEKEHKVKILYACESGSRAWGVPSPNSDYDIRVIYSHSPEWYLSVNDKSDNILFTKKELIDIQAWDLKKALSLLSKSNTVLYEWLQSQEVYAGCPVFLKNLSELSKKYFQPRKSIYHYLGLSNALINKHFDAETIIIKKYFIIVRSILAALWVKTHQSPAPVLFTDLLVILEDHPKVLSTVHQLIRLKKESNEGKSIARFPTLDQFIFETRKSCSVYAESLVKDEGSDTEHIDVFFRQILNYNPKAERASP